MSTCRSTCSSTCVARKRWSLSVRGTGCGQRGTVHSELVVDLLRTVNTVALACCDEESRSSCASCVSEEYACLWQECGFCAPESPTDLVRHVYFHCYHTKLKQWGLHALQSQSDLTPCQLDFQSRNIIPEIQENFLCLWEYCEVSGTPWVERRHSQEGFCLGCFLWQTTPRQQRRWNPFLL